MNKEVKFEELLHKIQKAKDAGTVDLSTEEDLALGVMNLVSLEEHFFMSGVKTKKEGYFDLLDEVRAMRKTLLARLVPKHEGETWCVSKHLLATTMRLIEVGTKLHADGKREEAKELFSHAHKTFSLFWGLRLKLIDLEGLKAVAADEKPWSLQDIVDKMVNCCDE